MKIKILLAITALGSLSAFSNFEKNTPYTSTTKILQTGEPKILTKQDCATCHKIDKKVIGPSYQDIAAKYPSNEKNIKYIADKIIKGGSGVWGEVPMLAHTTLKKEDAKKIAKYILSLKKESSK